MSALLHPALRHGWFDAGRQAFLRIGLAGVVTFILMIVAKFRAAE